MAQNKKNLALIVLLSLVFVGFFACKLLLPDKDFSEAERRRLTPLPELSASSVASGSFMRSFEDYALDHFPLRESFRSLKAAVHLGVLRQKDNNGLYDSNGYLAKQEYPQNSASLEHAADIFREIYQRYLAPAQAQVYYSVVPDKNAFLAAESGHLQLDYDALYAALREALPEQMRYIDITQLLSAQDYYRTDPHWRHEALTDVAQQLLRAMDAPSDARFTERTLDSPFYGVYAGQLPVPVQPDTITVLEHADFADCTVFDWENNREIPIYDLERAEGLDPYETYLSGALSLITMENPNCTSGRQLLIFRDSFASALAPLLLPSYSKITLIDVRYLSSKTLDRFVDFDGQDVLFLYSTSVLNNSEVLK